MKKPEKPLPPIKPKKIINTIYSIHFDANTFPYSLSKILKKCKNAKIPNCITDLSNLTYEDIAIDCYDDYPGFDVMFNVQVKNLKYKECLNKYREELKLYKTQIKIYKEKLAVYDKEMEQCQNAKVENIEFLCYNSS